MAVARRAGAPKASRGWRFTSLRYALERLQEAEYFLGWMTIADNSTFPFHLHAFLSACFNAIEMAGKSLAGTPGFRDWLRSRKDEIAQDPSMNFFMASRHLLTHEGPVPYVAGANRDGGWSFLFVDARGDMPSSLARRDVRDCCAEHLAKLAGLMKTCAERFPYNACPGRAFTEEGMNALGYSLQDAVEAAGFPREWADAGAPLPIANCLEVLRREIEPLDVDELQRLATGQFRRDGADLRIPKAAESGLLSDYAEVLGQTQGGGANPRVAFMTAVGRRMKGGE
jgi:hypothetical protein